MSDSTRQVREDAVQWLLRLEEAPENIELKRELEEWLQEDASHKRVFHQISMIWSAAGSAEPPNRSPLPVLPLLLILCLFLAFWAYQQPDLKAPVGEITSVHLPGGSVLTLAPGSAVNIDIDAEARKIELLKGAVYAEVDSSKLTSPFIVESESGKVRALGTRFSVQREHEGLRVDVYESSVELRPNAAPKARLKLLTGESGMLYREAAQRLGDALHGQPAWLTGQLVFRRTPLREVLAVLQRYDKRWQWIRLTEKDLNTTFSGVLLADDLDSAYAVLSQSMALEIDYPVLGITRIQKK